MASGHVNRTNRPNTWLHRPALRREDSPCQLGAVHTWHKADMEASSIAPLLGSKPTIDTHCEPFTQATRLAFEPRPHPAAAHRRSPVVVVVIRPGLFRFDVGCLDDRPPARCLFLLV